MDWNQPPIQDVYFDDDNNNINNDCSESDNIIHGVIVKELEVKCKEDIKYARQKETINLGYVDYFNYKFINIKNVNLFKCCMDITYVDRKL
jgi:hypothetical protein